MATNDRELKPLRQWAKINLSSLWVDLSEVFVTDFHCYSSGNLTNTMLNILIHYFKE
jgi:hypothetical protein